MTTTALVVEILVAGLLALVWLIAVPLAILFPEMIGGGLSRLKDLSGYSVLLGLLLLATAYPLGWLVNFITYKIASLTYRRTLLRQIFGPNVTSDSYRRLKAFIVMEKGCDEIVKIINNLVSVHRLSRAGGFNLLIIGLMLLFLAEEPAHAFFGTVCLLLGLSFWLLALQKHRVSYLWLRYAAERFPEGQELLSSFQEKNREAKDIAELESIPFVDKRELEGDEPSLLTAASEKLAGKSSNPGLNRTDTALSRGPAG